MRIRKVDSILMVTPESGHEFNALHVFTSSQLKYYRREYDLRRGTMQFSPIKLFEWLSGKLYLPTGFWYRLRTFLESSKIIYTLEHDNIPKPDWKALESFTLRPLQRECLEAIVSSVENNFGALVAAPPAFGKSFLISALTLLYPYLKIDVVTRRRDVAKSNYQTLLKFTSQVGFVSTGKKTKDRVTVYTAGSLGFSDYCADLLVLDEAHELVTDHYFSKLLKYPSFKIGLTATPDTRFDNLHIRLEALCGPVVFSAPYSVCTASKIVVPILVQWFDPPVTNFSGLGLNDIELKRAGIWQNKQRNEYIAKIARFFRERGYQVLILTETVEHVLNLKAELPEFEMCYGSYLAESRRYRQDHYEPISLNKREELRRKFMSREILGVISTNIWAVGVSFDSLEVLIRADGTSSLTQSIQAPGRVCRISDGKECGLVVDFLDRFDPRLHKKAKRRARAYAKQNWVQVDPNGRPLDLARC